MKKPYSRIGAIRDSRFHVVENSTNDIIIPDLDKAIAEEISEALNCAFIKGRIKGYKKCEKRFKKK